MALLDTTIVSIAIPSIIEAIDASLATILWNLNAFVDATHPTHAVPIVVVALAALSCLALERRKGAQPEELEQRAERAAV